MMAFDRSFRFKSHVHNMSTKDRTRVFIKIKPEIREDLDKNFEDGEFLNITIKAENRTAMSFYARIQRINRDKKVAKNYRIEIPQSHLPLIQEWMYEEDFITVVISHYIP